ncbi:hypothetical protein SE92_16400 [Bradyrhizobium sp. AT1]|nr:hypothetical protein SE92_16400 [Bradyrhizobium sp. AT1]
MPATRFSLRILYYRIETDIDHESRLDKFEQRMTLSPARSITSISSCKIDYGQRHRSSSRKSALVVEQIVAIDRAARFLQALCAILADRQQTVRKAAFLLATNPVKALANSNNRYGERVLGQPRQLGRQFARLQAPRA